MKKTCFDINLLYSFSDLVGEYEVISWHVSFKYSIQEEAAF